MTGHLAPMGMKKRSILLLSSGFCLLTSVLLFLVRFCIETPGWNTCALSGLKFFLFRFLNISKSSMKSQSALRIRALFFLQVPMEPGIVSDRVPALRGKWRLNGQNSTPAQKVIAGFDWLKEWSHAVKVPSRFDAGLNR